MGVRQDTRADHSGRHADLPNAWRTVQDAPGPESSPVRAPSQQEAKPSVEVPDLRKSSDMMQLLSRFKDLDNSKQSYLIKA